jgi:hypothetical protein
MKKIALPQTWNDFSIAEVEHLIRLSKELDVNEQPTFNNKVRHLSYYSGMGIDELSECSPLDVNKAFDHLLTCINNYTPKEPPREVEVNGTTYVLIDIDKQKARWLIDFEASQEDFESKPERMAALCYVEKGKQYGEVPLVEREKILREHCPAFVYLDLCAFFLNKSIYYMNAQALLLRAKERELKRQTKRIERNQRIKATLHSWLRKLSTPFRSSTR